MAQEENITRLDHETIDGMIESAWNELMSKHPISGSKGSIKIAMNLFEFGYRYALKDISGLSIGLAEMDELLKKQV